VWWSNVKLATWDASLELGPTHRLGSVHCPEYVQKSSAKFKE
jgi:hypothetical protein